MNVCICILNDTYTQPHVSQVHQMPFPMEMKNEAHTNKSFINCCCVFLKNSICGIERMLGLWMYKTVIRNCLLTQKCWFGLISNTVEHNKTNFGANVTSYTQFTSAARQMPFLMNKCHSRYTQQFNINLNNNDKIVMYNRAPCTLRAKISNECALVYMNKKQGYVYDIKV